MILRVPKRVIDVVSVVVITVLILAFSVSRFSPLNLLKLALQSDVTATAPLTTHIVLFQFKDTASHTAIKEATSKMLALKKNCIHPSTNRPYILSIAGGRDISIENLHGGMSHAFVVQFYSNEDRDYYVDNDPAHQEFKDAIKDVIEKAQVLDFQDGVMLRVLKAPENLGALLSELQTIFANAPPIPNTDAEADSGDGHRKPIEGECPICYTEFKDKSEAIVYGRKCGLNVHEYCMALWASKCVENPTCPYCKASWVGDEVSGEVDLESAEMDEDGHANVADQLRLSGERDYSTYNRYWVQRRPPQQMVNLRHMG